MRAKHHVILCWIERHCFCMFDLFFVILVIGVAAAFAAGTVVGIVSEILTSVV